MIHRYCSTVTLDSIEAKEAFYRFKRIHFGGPSSHSNTSRYLRSTSRPPSTCRPTWVNAKPGRAKAPQRVHRPPRRSRDHDGSLQGFPYLKRISELDACWKGPFPFRRYWHHFRFRLASKLETISQSYQSASDKNTSQATEWEKHTPLKVSGSWHSGKQTNLEVQSMEANVFCSSVQDQTPLF